MSISRSLQLLLGALLVITYALPLKLTAESEIPVAENSPEINQQRRHIRKKAFRDPLNKEQIDRVFNALSNKYPELERPVRKTFNVRQLNSASSNIASERPVLLLMEKRPQDKNALATRMTDVYYYNYKKDETIHLIVNQEDGKIHKRRSVKNVQLPLIPEEIQRAYNIYLQSPHLQDLSQAYFDATAQMLIDMNKINFKAFIFHGEDNLNELNKEAKRCGKTRCAQLLLYTDENIALNLSPVINLSKGIVVQANTFPQNTEVTLPGSLMHHNNDQHTP